MGGVETSRRVEVATPFAGTSIRALMELPSQSSDLRPHRSRPPLFVVNLSFDAVHLAGRRGG